MDKIILLELLSFFKWILLGVLAYSVFILILYYFRLIKLSKEYRQNVKKIKDLEKPRGFKMKQKEINRLKKPVSTNLQYFD